MVGTLQMRAYAHTCTSAGVMYLLDRGGVGDGGEINSSHEVCVLTSGAVGGGGSSSSAAN